MPNETILEYALGAFSHIAVHETCTSQFVDAGAVEPLLFFLGAHREALHVVWKSLVPLRRLLNQSQEPPSFVLRQISCAGFPEGHRGIQLIVDAIQDHVYAEPPFREASLLLPSFSPFPGNVPVLMSLPSHPSMKARGVPHPGVPVADALAGLLAPFPIEEDDSWPKRLEPPSPSLGPGVPVPY
eukprot:UN3305